MNDLRGDQRGWLIGGAVAVLALLLVWCLGGLDRVDAHLGRQVPLGEPLQGRRWTLAVNSAHVQLGYTEETEILIEVDAMFTGDRAAASPTQGVLVVKTPDGYAVEEFVWRGAPGFGQPGVRSSAEVSVPCPQWKGGDMPIQVAVFDERRGQSFIQDERWEPAAALGHVALMAVDTR
ncbi:hypothetical protein [Propioniferax innocua]|uniref:Uncharacterized protein n=1 Tax=Propioniferax innocua TaxID=1753 RepID=A0A542ZBY1_9ACTN|nr:hypothetical protein [Propioniferax innocua]TQL57855.1 hypothetical protein FB460_1700 [Propioniferax innocua]